MASSEAVSVDAYQQTPDTEKQPETSSTDFKNEQERGNKLERTVTGINDARAYYNDADFKPITFAEVFFMILGEIIPLPSDYNVCDIVKGPKYPSFLNFNVLRVNDFFAGLGMAVAAVLEVIGYLSGEVGLGLAIASNIFVFGGINGKVKQVLRMPDWTVQRKLSLRCFGSSFTPVDSSARRSQMAIFAVEGLLCFSPIMNLLVVGLIGWEQDVATLLVIGWRVFLTIFFFTMALFGLCPIWSATGLLVKLRLIRRPKGKVDPILRAHMTTTSYFYKMSPEDDRICSAVRYGFCGPLMRTDHVATVSRTTQDDTHEVTI